MHVVGVQTSVLVRIVYFLSVRQRSCKAYLRVFACTSVKQEKDTDIQQATFRESSTCPGKLKVSHIFFLAFKANEILIPLKIMTQMFSLQKSCS